MNNNDKLFIGTEIVKAVENSVKILLPHVHSKDRCMGWFCEDPLELIVTTKHTRAEFLGVFVHESCHMDQFLEQTEEWVNPVINDHGDVLKEYLTWERRNKTRLVVDYVYGSLALELDCEKRAVKKIKRHKLSLDLENYIRRANVYLYSWPEFMNLRCWYQPHKKPYDDPEILANMPTKLLTLDEYWNGNSQIHEFLKENGKFLVDKS